MCGHPVIEKLQKIHLYDIIFHFFGCSKISDFSIADVVIELFDSSRRVYQLEPSKRARLVQKLDVLDVF